MDTLSEVSPGPFPSKHVHIVIKHSPMGVCFMLALYAIAILLALFSFPS